MSREARLCRERLVFGRLCKLLTFVKILSIKDTMSASFLMICIYCLVIFERGGIFEKVGWEYTLERPRFVG